MNFIAVVKRVAPFVLTLAIGLFIASFFVTVAAPNFQFKRSNFKRHREYDRQREARINDLEKENDCLKRKMAEMEKRDWVLGTVEVPMNPPAPPAPVVPMRTVPLQTR
jgi:hypothetical protein